MFNKNTMIEVTFTTFIVFMIFLPLPPSTIIGVALASNPKTGKYMNKTVYRYTNKTTGMIGLAIKAPIVALANGRQASANARLQAGLVRL